MSDACQRWIDYNFPVMYTLKGLHKTSVGDEKKRIFTLMEMAKSIDHYLLNFILYQLGIADDYTVEDFGEVRIRYNDKFYHVIIGTGHNNVFACLNFLPTLARKISHEQELNLALEYVSGIIDYFIEENKNDGTAML